jgi:hypothetical protein
MLIIPLFGLNASSASHGLVPAEGQREVAIAGDPVADPLAGCQEVDSVSYLLLMLLPATTD